MSPKVSCFFCSQFLQLLFRRQQTERFCFEVWAESRGWPFPELPQGGAEPLPFPAGNSTKHRLLPGAHVVYIQCALPSSRFTLLPRGCFWTGCGCAAGAALGGSRWCCRASGSHVCAGVVVLNSWGFFFKSWMKAVTLACRVSLQNPVQ